VARPLRIEFAGAVYHVIGRGNAKQDVFLDGEDYARFIRLTRRVVDRLDWRILTYCLMPNHYHLAVETPEPNLSRGMHDLIGHYSQTFNARHGRVGHVFQGRFKALLIDQDTYLLQLVRYILMNPVEAGLCAAPEAWRWSSYARLFGAPNPLVSAETAGRIVAMVDADLACGRRRLRAFVRVGQEGGASTEVGLNRTIVGDEMFVTHQRPRVPVSRENSRADRVFSTLAEFTSNARSRNDAIRAAYASGMFTQQAIARHFQLHYTTVSRIIGAANAKIQDLTPNFHSHSTR